MNSNAPIISGLPNGWVSTRLGELVELKYGDGLPKKKRMLQGSVPVYGSNGIVGCHDSAITTGPTIIIGRKGSVGAINKSQGPCWPIDTTYYVDKLPTGLSFDFLFYFLRSHGLRELDRSTAIPGINRDDVYAMPFALPPASEQKRIVAKIEELLRELRTARPALRKIPSLIKRFRQSVLKKAFRGELTERDPNDEPAKMILGHIEKQTRAEWDSESKGRLMRIIGDEKARFSTMREELSEIPDSWIWTTLSSLAEVKGGVAKGRRFPGRHTVKAPYLRVANVQSGYLDLTTLKEIEVLPEEVEDYQLWAGDILFTEGGDRDKLGRGTVWANEVPRCIHQNHIFRARLKTKEVLPQYISFLSQSVFGRDYFSSVASQTVNLASINITSLRSFPIPLAPVREQFRIVKNISQFFADANQIEESVKGGLDNANVLERSILARAFRGELVLQDPDDEPASILLERIRASRAAMGKRVKSQMILDVTGSARITQKG